MTHSEHPMTGKVCLVTGATDGIGRETARALASLGATVILHGRSPAKMRETVQAITAQTGGKPVHALLADFADFAQVRDLAAQVNATYDRLDVLVNNAGGIMLRRQNTRAGLEMTFVVNHLAPFLLTNLLLDRMKASAPARIVTVASAAHLRAVLDVDDLHQTRRYHPFRAYAASKLANLLFTYELARRLEGTGVTANALHPGLVGTNIAMNNIGPLAPVGRWVLRRMAISVEEGARTVVYLAASPEVEGVNGEYFYQERAIPSSEASYAVDAQRRLWAISEQLTGFVQGEAVDLG